MYHSPEKYLTYVRNLNTSCREILTDNAPAIHVVHGSCDYLVNRSSQALANNWQRHHKRETISIEGEKLDRDGYFELLQCEGLFESHSLYIVKRAERCGELAAWIKATNETNLGGNGLIINLHRPSVAAGLLKDLARLNARIIACHEPHTSQLIKFVQTLAKNNDISLSLDAVSLMITNLGEDLSQIDNEIKKLSLIFAGANQEITTDMIAPHLGLLREDDAFALDDLLSSKEFVRAHLLLDNLLERGQAPLAVLGILSRHCRNVLSVSTLKAQGQTPKQMATELKLPVPVVRKFLNITNQSSIERAKRALAACQQCDQSLKSSKIPADLVLSKIIDELAASSYPGN